MVIAYHYNHIIIINSQMIKFRVQNQQATQLQKEIHKNSETVSQWVERAMPTACTNIQEWGVQQLRLCN